MGIIKKIVNFVKWNWEENQAGYARMTSQEETSKTARPIEAPPLQENLSHAQGPSAQTWKRGQAIPKRDMLDEAVIHFMECGLASYSLLERRLGINYRAAVELVDKMEMLGIIGQDNKYASRKVITTEEEYFKRKPLLNIGFCKKVDYSKIDAMVVIHAMETQIESLYQTSMDGVHSAEMGEYLFNEFKNNCMSSKLPLAAEVRLTSLLSEYEEKFLTPKPFVSIDKMDGHQFEKWCASLLEQNGFIDICITKGSGDQGVDIVAIKDEIHYAIQCKCYKSDLDNTPIQQVYAGKTFYHCQVAVVMTNQYFTKGAVELAQATGVLLWDRDKLKQMMESAAP